MRRPPRRCQGPSRLCRSARDRLALRPRRCPRRGRGGADRPPGGEHPRDRGLGRGAVGQQRRGVDRVVPGEDARGRQRAEVLAGVGVVPHPLRGQRAPGSASASSRSRWASTIAPTAAVISSALVTSKAKTYRVNSMLRERRDVAARVGLVEADARCRAMTCADADDQDAGRSSRPTRMAPSPAGRGSSRPPSRRRRRRPASARTGTASGSRRCRR